MIMTRYCSLLVLCCLLAAASPAKSQTFEAGFMAGTTFYLGDMQPYDTPADLFKNPRYAGGVFGRYNLSQHISLRANIIYARIAGENVGPYEMPADYESFQTWLAEFSVVAEVNFLPYIAGDMDKRATPFIYGGTGTMFFNEPYTGENKLRPKDIIPQKIILGLGARYNFSRKITVGLDWGMRRTSDELDGVFNIGVNEAYGIPEDRDWYSFLGMTVSYRFKDRSGAYCPPH